MNRITPVQDVPPVLLRHFQGALEALHSLEAHTLPLF